MESRLRAIEGGFYGHSYRSPFPARTKSDSFDFIGAITHGKTLLVGEGNLSFARSLAEMSRVIPSRLTATTFESERNISPDAAENAQALRSLGASVLSIVPVKGDARTTCRILTRPLSFVWLDIDMDVLMDSVLEIIRPLLTCDTIIGLDDYGRPETPTVKPWADQMEAENRWTKLEQYPEHIAFYQVK